MRANNGGDTDKMPLNLAEFEKIYRIVKVCGTDKHKHYLESLGFVAGSQVQLLSKLHDYFIVLVKDTKIGIDRKMAQNIILLAE